VATYKIWRSCVASPESVKKQKKSLTLAVPQQRPAGRNVMHRSRLGGIVIDCRDANLDQAGTFWGGVFGYEATRAPDPADTNYVELSGPPGELHVLLQRVEHPSRVHLDIETDDIEAEAARLEGLGARRIEHIRDWLVMEAPTGHRFCLVPPQRDGFLEHATVWP